MMASCHLELMGLHDAAAYRRLCSGILWSARPLLRGLNIPNKKPGEPLLEWARVVHHEFPELPLCVHYSLKHQRAREDPVSLFIAFCAKAVETGVQSVLLVTGPSGPRLDTVAILEKLKGRHPAPGLLRLGVAFNACLPTEAERRSERERLVRKLKTGLIEEVWFNCGADTELLEEGVSFAKACANGIGLPGPLTLFGSILRPNEAQLQQMRERPWNGVHFGEEYLGSLAGMDRLTRAVLATYGSHGVTPIVESKVRSREDVEQLHSLLKDFVETSGPRQQDTAAADFGDHQFRPPTPQQDNCVKSSGHNINDVVKGDLQVEEMLDQRSSNTASFYPPPRRARRWTAREGKSGNS